jgi:hypothetical protein
MSPRVSQIWAKWLHVKIIGQCIGVEFTDKTCTVLFESMPFACSLAFCSPPMQIVSEVRPCILVAVEPVQTKSFHSSFHACLLLASCSCMPLPFRLCCISLFATAAAVAHYLACSSVVWEPVCSAVCSHTNDGSFPSTFCASQACVTFPFLPVLDCWCLCVQLINDPRSLKN